VYTVAEAMAYVLVAFMLPCAGVIATHRFQRRFGDTKLRSELHNALKKGWSLRILPALLQVGVVATRYDVDAAQSKFVVRRVMMPLAVLLALLLSIESSSHLPLIPLRRADR
jgi:hypothetical protein